jgi:glyoxylate reductase
MSKPILVITRRLPPRVEARAARHYDVRLNTDGAALDAPAILDRAQDAAALLVCPGDPIRAPLIEALPASVRVIGTFSVGYDHIDTAAAKARGITVCNTPDVLTQATAEIAMLLILGAARRAGEGERLLRAGRWTGWEPLQHLGTQVSGRRLGIFGFGRIGRAVARLGRGFGMEIHYRSRSRVAPALEEGAIFHENDSSFLAASQVLSLNAPGSAGTRHWLNTDRIAALPDGAIVVNAARGSLIDDAALIAALRSGKIAAAGLDVFDGEPRVDPGYLALENAFLLPHLGSATVETRDAMGMMAMDGIDAVLAGREPPSRVV